MANIIIQLMKTLCFTRSMRVMFPLCLLPLPNDNGHDSICRMIMRCEYTTNANTHPDPTFRTIYGYAISPLPHRRCSISTESFPQYIRQKAFHYRLPRANLRSCHFIWMKPFSRHAAHSNFLNGLSRLHQTTHNTFHSSLTAIRPYHFHFFPGHFP